MTNDNRDSTGQRRDSNEALNAQKKISVGYFEHESFDKSMTQTLIVSLLRLWLSI